MLLRIYDLNNPLQFEKADIGRCLVQETAPKIVTTPAPQELTTPTPPAQCSNLMPPTRQTYELTFGDTKNSFGVVNVQKRDIPKE